MKQYRALSILFMLVVILLSACGAPASTSPTGAPKVEADTIVTGVIESMNGTQWVVKGQTFTVDPAVVLGGPYKVGDVIKAEGKAQPDGSVVVSRVETPGPDDLATATVLANNNTNDDNSNDANANDANSNDANTNDANSNDTNGNDDNSNNTNSNDDNSNDANGNDDNSNDANTNDDNSNSGSNDNSANDNSGNDNGSGGGDDGDNDNGGGGKDDSGGGGGNDNDSGGGGGDNDNGD